MKANNNKKRILKALAIVTILAWGISIIFFIIWIPSILKYAIEADSIMYLVDISRSKIPTAEMKFDLNLCTTRIDNLLLLLVKTTPIHLISLGTFIYWNDDKTQKSKKK